MSALVKICGLSTPHSLETAIGAGADWVGFVRYENSPRHVGLEFGRLLAQQARGRARQVVLLVDPDDAALDAVLTAMDPDLVQLHGTETPERVANIKARTGKPVMKALGVADASDLARIRDFSGAADHLLLDAKPPKGSSALPGGNGVAFDWAVLADLDPSVAFMLSGGLDPGNVARAIRLTGARAVDVSSGVERERGVKDSDKIAAFVKAARAAFAAGDS